MPIDSKNRFPLPAASGLSTTNKFYKEIIILHEEACRKKLNTYIDPETGYTVFTGYYHLKRGNCCGSGCRHCPFGG